MINKDTLYEFMHLVGLLIYTLPKCCSVHRFALGRRGVNLLADTGATSTIAAVSQLKVSEQLLIMSLEICSSEAI